MSDVNDPMEDVIGKPTPRQRRDAFGAAAGMSICRATCRDDAIPRQADLVTDGHRVAHHGSREVGLWDQAPSNPNHWLPTVVMIPYPVPPAVIPWQPLMVPLDKEWVLQNRRLGRTGLDISLLTFGCGAVGGLMTKGDAADQMRAVRRALEIGVNFFDTAPLYGNGTSETNVGRIFRELKPDAILATKVNVPPEQKGNIGAAIERSIEESLRRLQRDYVDLLQLHNSISPEGQARDLHPDAVLGEVVPVFEKLKQAGKIRFAGITAIGDTASLHAVVGSGRFDTAQVVYNLLNPSAGGPLPKGFPAQDYDELLVKAAAAGMGTIVIRVLAGGALSGQGTRHPLGMQEVAPIGSGIDYRADVMSARRFDPAVTLAGAADKVELAIRYVASHKDVSTLQVGIATPEQFEGAAEALSKGPLSTPALERIAELQSAVQP